MQRPCGEGKHSIFKRLNGQCGQEEEGRLTHTLSTTVVYFPVFLSQLDQKTLASVLGLISLYSRV